MDFQKGGLWRNWVGNQSCVAKYKASPGTEAELAEMVSEAAAQGLNVRCSGSGHSFTPIVLTDGLLLSLDNLSGITSVDPARNRVSIAAGTRLGVITRELKKLNLSLENQGDIESQSIAGATSTGTHGTGIGLRNMSSQIVGMRIVKTDGSILHIDDNNEDMLHAAQVAVGTLGVVSEITIQALPAYKLHKKIWREDFHSCIENMDEMMNAHRHFGFFWCPTEESASLYNLPDTSGNSKTSKTADICEMISMDETDSECMQQEFEQIAYSSENFAVDYIANFHELEYAVPVEHGKQALIEVRELILNKHQNCIYPVEIRFVAGDDTWLSPFYKQDSLTLSVSGGPGVDYWEFLTDVDQILRRYQSRPHWGKIHFMDADDVTSLYPRAQQFREFRNTIDPEGVFLNGNLKMMLG